MHSIEVEGTDVKWSFPETGLEFNKRQFLLFSKWMNLHNCGLVTFEQFKVKLTYEFLNLKRKADIERPENHAIAENILEISKLIEGYFSIDEESGKAIKVMDMVFYQQLLPKFRIAGITYHGPDTALFNTVYGEYLQALSAFNDFSSTGEEEHLDRMIATLYRPKKWFYHLRRYLPGFKSDKRRAFNSYLTSVYLPGVKKLPASIKHAIYLYFASCQHFITNSTALDIGGGNQIDLSVIFQKTKSTNKTAGVGMVGTLYSIAEAKVFGNVKEVAHQNTYDVFAYLVDQHHKMKKSKTKGNAQHK